MRPPHLPTPVGLLVRISLPSCRLVTSPEPEIRSERDLQESSDFLQPPDRRLLTSFKNLKFTPNLHLGTLKGEGKMKIHTSSDPHTDLVAISEENLLQIIREALFQDFTLNLDLAMRSYRSFGVPGG